ncbi:MAG: L,D-transpeptidase family protein [Ignavibacteriales bacterium]|nr:L,D-transpeptidase family protein [Ignavibacteriales bacterium]
MNIRRSFFIFAAIVLCPLIASGQLKRTPLASSKQIVVVITDSWDAVDGVLRGYERPDLNAKWQAVTPKTSIVVGRRGLAWGTGLHGAALSMGPIKKEGDGRAPAGVFSLSAVFGSAPTDSVRASLVTGFPRAEQWAGKTLKMPYIFLDSTSVCVDDIRSQYYNRILSKRDVKQDWKSAEDMLDPAYKWGVVVDHNADPRKAGDGSCIFLHIWNGPSRGTAGCTAFDEQKLLGLLRWLDPASRPVLVQLTKADYQRLSKEWGLPE